MTFSQLLKGESNAKGRTEQIAILKEKVKDLNRKLASVTRSTPGTATPVQIAPLDANDHNGIYKQELHKRKEIEKLSVEIEKLAADLAEAKKKNEGLSARTK